MVNATDITGVPKPIDVGPEMEVLRRFIPDAVTWEGTIHGGMGPGTPKMRGVGRGRAKLIQAGRWIAGDYEQDQFLDDGTFVLTWFTGFPGGLLNTVSIERRWRTTTETPAYTEDHIDADKLVFESMGRNREAASLHLGCLRIRGDHLAERDGDRRRRLIPDRGVRDDPLLRAAGPV